MSFIRDYMVYADTDEAPHMFHVWCGYAILAAAVERRFWLNKGETCRFPNIYTMLVGPAGNGKSQALKKAQRMLTVYGETQMSHSVETPEAFLKHLGGSGLVDKDKNPIPSPCCRMLKWPDGDVKPTHASTIIANEFIDFIRSNPFGWTGMLNNIYDEYWHYSYRTIIRGTEIVLGPCVNLLGAIPTELSKRLQSEEVITSGFARRCIFQYGERRFNDPHPEEIYTETERQAEQRCLTTLKELSKRSGEIKRSQESMQWWDTWYRSHSKSICHAKLHTRSWLTSKPEQVLKIAMLNCLGRNDELIIQPIDFELAIEWFGVMESSLIMVFGGIGRNELAGLGTKILEWLSQQEVASADKQIFAQFYNYFAAGKASLELNEMMNYLVESGETAVLSLVINGESIRFYGSTEQIAKLKSKHSLK